MGKDDSGLMGVYARIVMPPLVGGAKGDFFDQSVRHGCPRVVLMDEEGNDVAELKGMRGAEVVAMVNEFMVTSIDVIAKVEFPEDA